MIAPVPHLRHHAPPLIYAHRGASAERPENTLAAFRRAEDLRADGIELDVMRCGSGEVVVFHDDDLQRLCRRKEKIRRTALPVLRKLDLGAGEGIPTLDEVYSAVGKDLRVNVELKAPTRHGLTHLATFLDDGLASEVAAIIARNGAARTLVSSFDPVLLARFQRVAPGVQTGLLVEPNGTKPLREGWFAHLLRPAAVHPEASLCTGRSVDRWHRDGRAVNAWTVDDPHEVAFLAAIGVDGVITNRPEVARAAIAFPAKL